MSAGRVLLGTVVAAVGAALAGGALWGLLNVPESSVPMLLVSALLALLVPVLLGLTTATVLGIVSGHGIAVAARRATTGLRGFAAGLLVLALLWYVTGAIADLWVEHGGEIDALFLRYAKTASTAWLHTGVGWLLWLACWGLGLAATAGATRGALDGSGVLPGLARALSPRLLGTTLIALLLVYGLWQGVYWRPQGLPDDSAELLFVGAKLGVLFIVGAVIAVAGLAASESAPR